MPESHLTTEKSKNTIDYLWHSTKKVLSQYLINLNGKEYRVVLEGDKIFLNGKAVNIDVAQLREKEWHLLRDGKSYRVEWNDGKIEEKEISLKVNNTQYQAAVKDKFDLLLEKMGMSDKGIKQAGVLKSPMPGKVLRIDVEVGQTVKKGDAILILEAMKMENAIKAPGEGTVKSILIKTGDALEKGVVMVEFE